MTGVEPERLFPLPPQETLSRQDTLNLGETSARLYRKAQFRFGDTPLEGMVMDADHISNLARYARDGRIATVKIGEEACLDGLDPSRGIMHLMVESPVPSTPDFPNVYIADHFVILHGMYNHSLSVSAYDAEGDPLPSEDDDTAVALMDELTERDANGEVRFSDDAMTQVLLARLSKLREQRVGRLLLEFPEDLAEFDPSKQIEHILNQLRWLSRLTVLDEVGMSVEPYLRD